MLNEILKMAGNDSCAEVGARLGVPSHTVASVLNLSRLVREELIEAAPAVNCWNLARLPQERQESLFDAALVMSPRQFEEACK